MSTDRLLPVAAIRNTHMLDAYKSIARLMMEDYIETEERHTLSSALDSIAKGCEEYQADIDAMKYAELTAEEISNATVHRNVELLDMCKEATYDRDIAIMVRDEALQELQNIAEELSNLRNVNTDTSTRLGHASQHGLLAMQQRDSLNTYRTWNTIQQDANPYITARDMQSEIAVQSSRDRTQLTYYNPPQDVNTLNYYSAEDADLVRSIRHTQSLQDEIIMLNNTVEEYKQKLETVTRKLQVSTAFGKYMRSVHEKSDAYKSLQTVDDSILNIWCTSRVEGRGPYRYSFVNIRDKIAHTGHYSNINPEGGDLCMIINIITTYGVNICIHTDCPRLCYIISSKDPLTAIHVCNDPIGSDLLQKGVSSCIFRTYREGAAYEGLLLASRYIDAKFTHSTEWKLVIMS